MWTVETRSHVVEDTIKARRASSFRVVDGAPVGRTRGSYCPVTPELLANKLSSRFNVEVIPSRKKPGNALVNVYARDRRLGPSTDLYEAACRIWLDHYGRASVLLAAGATRMACANQFHQPFLVLPHCGEEIRMFVDMPELYVNRVLEEAPKVARAVEALLEIPYAAARDAAHRVYAGLKLFAPRLHTTLCRETAKRRLDATPWGIAQAATWTRRPGLCRLANKWVFEPAFVDPSLPLPLDFFDPNKN